MLKPRALPGLFVEAIKSWSDDNATSRSASLSYYTTFSLAPLLVIAVALAGLVFEHDVVNGALESQLAALFGPAGAKVILDMMASASKPGTGLLASILAVVILVLGSLGAFVELRDALNAVWKVKPKPTSGIVAFLRTRLLSFAMVAVLAFFLLASMVISTAIAALGHATVDRLPGGEVVTHLGNLLLSFLLLTGLFAAMFKVLPDTKVAWSDLWLGAAVTAFLFSVGKLLIGLYLGKSATASSYGAAGSFAVLLIWINYSAMILLLGAEFTYVYAKKHGTLTATGDRPATATPAGHEPHEASPTRA